MFIVYHDIRTEARSQEILECAKKLGDEVTLVSYSRPTILDGVRCIVTGKGKRKYFRFIWSAIRAIRLEDPDVVILHDNYTAVILGWLCKFQKDITVIYDSSELYIDGSPRSFKQWVARHMRYFEKKYLRYADLVVAANTERAGIMQKYFELVEMPIVFDNIHRIDDEYDENALEVKYGRLFTGNKFYILYAGGIATKRLTFDLAMDVGRLGDDYRLIICGSATSQNKGKLEDMIKYNSFQNVEYIGFVPRADLRYLLSRAHVNVSVFAQDTLNNIYCASGKLYEGLFEGVPVLVSENPPLKRLCEETGVGVSTNDFQQGIVELRQNYNKYKQNVISYINTIDFDRRVETLATILKKRLSQVNAGERGGRETF